MGSNDVMIGYNRQSFSDRICDDLCQEVLKWLPLRDKFRLKSVSKQFKRSVEEVLRRETILSACDLPETQTRHRAYGLDIELLTMTLKAMPNINEIRFDYQFCLYIDHECDSDEEIEMIRDLMNAICDIITDNCHQLKTIVFPFSKCDEKVLKRFGQKFGHSLTSIQETICSADWRPETRFVKFCTKLISITGQFNCLDQFEERLQRLTHLDIFFGPNLLEEQTFLCLKPLSKLHSLKKLSIHGIEVHTNEELTDLTSDEGLKAIAMNCKQLESFCIDIDIICDINDNKWFECFQHFRHLLRLDIGLYGTHELDISCLKTCHRLTHLTIDYNGITDETFDGIESVVPNLKNLYIKTLSNITDNALISVSKLKNLKSFKLMSILNSITDLDFISLIDNCIHLKTIAINGKIEITIQSLNVIIEKGLKYPKIDFKYEISFPVDLDMSEEVVKAIESKPHPLPNIWINFCQNVLPIYPIIPLFQ